MFTLELTVAGIATGCIYALAGMGLVLTYKATGIFNFAHGAIAMFVAYAFWQAGAEWHWPVYLAALFAIGGVGPAIGVVLEILVFRPLQRRRAPTAAKLVATIGVFLLVFGLSDLIWKGRQVQAPRLISLHAIHLPLDVVIGVDQLVDIILTVAIAGALAVMFRQTKLGVDIRAVVDRRELAELSSVNANRVAAISWALGCGLAGLTGVLLVQGGPLDQLHLILLVIETFSIAVVAGLTNLPRAVGAGILILGVFAAYFLPFEPTIVPGLHFHFGQTWRNNIDVFKPVLSAIVLFIALIVLRSLDEPSDAQTTHASLASGSVGRHQRRLGRRVGVLAAAGLAAMVLPYAVTGQNLGRAQIMLAMIVIFVSIVTITGFCGYITLGQAGFAGFGAYLTGRVAHGWHLPVVLAMLVGAAGTMLLGLVTGYPALRRRGLFLGLTTLSMGLLVYEAVLTSDVFKSRGLQLDRPSLFGISLGGDHAFYYFELVVVVLVLLLAHNLRSGRLGRILAAMRDSEVGAQSVGIEMRRYKLFIFAASSFIAGLGGALLTQQSHIFTGSESYGPIQSLLWFMVVIVAGVTSLTGAVLGGVLLIGLDVLSPRAGFSYAVIAMGALIIGYLPGGSLIGLGRRVWGSLSEPRGLQRRFSAALAAVGAADAAGGVGAAGSAGGVGAAASAGPVGGGPDQALGADANGSGMAGSVVGSSGSLAGSPAGADGVGPVDRRDLAPSAFARRVLEETRS